MDITFKLLTKQAEQLDQALKLQQRLSLQYLSVKLRKGGKLDGRHDGTI